ncbi:hypothetical protein [Corynebacterium epidermidicanis]|uniref:hypothetical protein n=1 Tax=Corynebacterium epidermidicanis TaxID=1050174 RepID=UPI00064156BA|nr:hypothetical protein [Corynebacterium epidermidicanis]
MPHSCAPLGGCAFGVGVVEAVGFGVGFEVGVAEVVVSRATVEDLVGVGVLDDDVGVGEGVAKAGCAVGRTVALSAQKQPRAKTTNIPRATNATFDERLM